MPETSSKDYLDRLHKLWENRYSEPVPGLTPTLAEVVATARSSYEEVLEIRWFERIIGQTGSRERKTRHHLLMRLNQIAAVIDDDIFDLIVDATDADFRERYRLTMEHWRMFTEGTRVEWEELGEYLMYGDDPLYGRPRESED